MALPLLVAVATSLAACGSGDQGEAADSQLDSAMVEKNTFLRPPLLNPNPTLPTRKITATALIGAFKDRARLAALPETNNGLPGLGPETPGFFSQQTSQLSSSRLSVTSHFSQLGSTDSQRRIDISVDVSTDMNTTLMFNGSGRISDGSTQRLSARAASIPREIFREVALITYRVPGAAGISVTLSVKPTFRFFEVCWQYNSRLDPRATPTTRNNCSRHDYLDGSAIGLSTSGIVDSTAYTHQPMRDRNKFRTLLRCRNLFDGIDNEYHVITHDPSMTHGGLGDRSQTGDYTFPATSTNTGDLVLFEQSKPFFRFEATVRVNTVVNFRMWAAETTPTGAIVSLMQDCWARSPLDR